MVPGCRDSYQSCCCPPSQDPKSENGKEASERPPHLCLKGANRQGQRAGPATDALH